MKHTALTILVLTCGAWFAGCVSPGAATLQPGAVAPHLGEANSAPLVVVGSTSQPAVVVHVEPVAHLYGDSPFDELAIRFQQKRGYTPNLVSELKMMQILDQTYIEKVQRTGVGSLFMEGYNVIVWRPIA